MSDCDFFSMSSNRNTVNKLSFKKKCSIPAFLSKMRALEKWCVTKVAHCSSEYFSLLLFSKVLKLLHVNTISLEEVKMVRGHHHVINY